jgi:CubicO group peptidase (beta-lactamase class C family)
MITHTSFLLVCLCLLSLFACSSAAEIRLGTSPNPHIETIAFAEGAIKQCMRKYHIPNVAVALIEDQNIVLLEAYGTADRGKNTPATIDTVYTVYSIAKPFTAIEIMRLYEEGFLDLDAPITDIIPDFSIQSIFPQSETITIRQLLSHRAGLPRNSNYHGTLREAGWRALELQVESLSDAYLAYPPGKRYKYSNIGYNMLGHIVETLREEDFVGYMDREFLQAIGMTNSSFLSERLPGQTDVAEGYEFYKRKYYPHKMGDIIQIASGNLFSSAADMAEFMRFILRGGFVDDESIIGANYLAQMFVPQYASDDDPQQNGLGWMISYEAVSELMVWHQGGDINANAVVALLPERKYGIALLTNSGSFDGSILVQLAIDILKNITGRETASSISDVEVTTKKPTEKEILDQYSGRYVVFGQVLRLYDRHKKLKASFGPITLSLNPTNTDEFVPSHWLFSLGFRDLFPTDLALVRFHFRQSGSQGEKQIIVRISDIHYEICDAYPPYDKRWDRIVGKYDGCEVTSEKDVLKMSNIGILTETSENIFSVAGGPFGGDIVLYDPEKDSLIHQGITYHRISD